MRTEDWEAIDSARIRAGGSWSDMKMLRVRRCDNVLEESDFTVLEIGIREGEIYTIRCRQRGSYAHITNAGPFLFWKFDAFVQWFQHEEHPDPEISVFNQVWARGKWVGHQAGLTEIMEAFT